MKKVNKYIIPIILIILSLTPILWFLGKGDVLIDGVDTNFPLNPEVWIGRRFFVWNSVVNAGSDFSSSTAGLFFHFIQYLPYKLTGNLQLTEIVSLIFWFSFIVFSSYIFSSVVLSKNKISQFIFVVLYSFNIYLFNAWENVKVANLALVVTLPLGMTLVSLLKDESKKKIHISFFSLIVGLLAAGAGINPAYITVLATSIILWFFILYIRERESLKAYDLLYILLPIVLINSYWVLPTIVFIFSQISSQNGLSSIGFSDWVDSLSQNTSLLNVIRLQGAWDWYAFDKGTPLYIPYATKYFFSIPFIIFSFLIPLLSFISFYFYNKKEKSLYSLFGIFFVLSVFLGAGTHEPTGVIFKFLGTHLPFFSLFRSPWYIFTPLLIFAYAGLVSLLISNLSIKYGNYRIFSQKASTIYIPFFSILLVVCQLIYSYPLITGKIFRPGRSDSFYVNFPSYIFEAKDWLSQNNNPINKRLVSYPDEQVYTYKWGYRGIESILDLFSNKNVITPSVNFGNEGWDALLSQFYLHLKRGEIQSAISILPNLGANSIVDMKDIVTLSPQLDENSLSDNFSEKKFGDWSFFTLKSNKSSLFYAPDQIYVNYGEDDTFSKLAPVLSQKPLVISSKDSILNKIDNLKYEVITSGQDISHKPMNPNRTFKFSVPRGGNYTLYLEKYGVRLEDIKSVLIDGAKVDKISYSGDSFIALGPVYIDKGDHRVEISFPDSENLITQNIQQANNIKLLRKNELPDNLDKTYVAYNDSTDKVSSIIYSSKIDPFTSYVLTFDYKYVYGKSASVVVNQSIPTSLVKTIATNVGYAADWQSGQIIFDPVRTPSIIKVSVAVDGDEKQKSKTYFQNFSIKKIYTNYLAVVENNNTNIISPDINYSQNNPTSYSVNVKNAKDPYFVIFLSTYIPTWKAQVVGENYIIEHITANGFANAWYIPNGKEEQLIKVDYSNQILYIIGAIISICFILIVSALSIFLYVKEKKKSK